MSAAGPSFISRIAPARFLLFVVATLAATTGLHLTQHSSLPDAAVTGFNIGVIVFCISLLPLGRDHSVEDMRCHSIANDANRAWVLAITCVVIIAIMGAMVAELPAAKAGSTVAVVKLVSTLMLGWIFTNLIFMLHYAHMHFAPGDGPGGVKGGFEFPGTNDPDYWDFLYFSFTAGMSFAASDVNVRRGDVRRVLVLQCILAFFFNIGALAFTINVLAGAAA